MNKTTSILCIFALSLLIIALYMNSINFWNAVIGITAGIIASLATAWSVIKFYLEKRVDDATFKQHMIDFEKSANRSFMAVSRSIDDVNKKLDKIDKKLDNHEAILRQHEASVGKLEGKIGR